MHGIMYRFCVYFHNGLRVVDDLTETGVALGDRGGHCLDNGGGMIGIGSGMVYIWGRCVNGSCGVDIRGGVFDGSWSSVIGTAQVRSKGASCSRGDEQERDLQCMR